MRASTFHTKVNVTHVGTATAILDIDGVTFLTDPFFSTAGHTWSFANDTLRVTENPALRLDQLSHIDAVLLSHENHPENLDELGRQLLDGRHVMTTEDGARNLAPRPSVLGFKDWQEREVRIAGRNYTITATPTAHWPGHEEDIGKIADKYSITVALINLGKATVDSLKITMDGKQAARLFRDLKAGALVPLHYESWKHFTQHGDGLSKEFADEGIADKVCWLKPGQAVKAN
ncbi:hypothetical protein VUR80DRAFT_8312 [Thermomyces stellatus]